MTVVVAGAVLRRGAAARELLLAQRSYPPELAGRWELPGGKVQTGETRAAALIRELDEELGVTVAVGGELAARVRLRADLTLVAFWARLVDGVPRAVEHRALAWVGADTLAAMAARDELVAADTAWLPELLGALTAR